MQVYSRKGLILRNSEALFRSLEEQATQDSFYTCMMAALVSSNPPRGRKRALLTLCWLMCLSPALNLPRDFSTEIALMTLHLWVLHNRFKVDYELPGIYCGRRLQVCGSPCLICLHLARTTGGWRAAC
jgi:hypothetical protein